jgi:dTDP-4-amino-4,6-dideoxygalactose transaminase
VVLGPEVEQFEAEFAEVAGTSHAVGVASGTDALELALRALELRPGSEVLCPNLTAVATAAAVIRAGLEPVFVDVDPETLTLSVEQAAAALTRETAAIVAVHLYGRPAPVAALTEPGLPVVEDCAHAHGLQVDGRPAGSVGRLGSFSFYPTKNLGAFGDGGAVTTSDPKLAERVRSLRAYGEEADGRVTKPGLNSRLDELQAALLRVRLRRLGQDNERRAAIAETYDAALCRRSPPGVHHLYVTRSPRRDELRDALTRAGIETAVHYPVALGDQPAFAGARHGGALETSETAAREVLSLPCYAHLTSDEEQRVAAELEILRTRFEVC